MHEAIQKHRMQKIENKHIKRENKHKSNIKNVSRVIRKQKWKQYWHNILHRAYIELHNYKSMIILTFHQRSSLHFAALHYTSLPIFHFTALLDVSSSPRYENPPLLLTYIYFPNPVSKMYDLQWQSLAPLQAVGMYHSLNDPLTKKYLPIGSSLSDPNLTTWILLFYVLFVCKYVP